MNIPFFSGTIKDVSLNLLCFDFFQERRPSVLSEDLSSPSTLSVSDTVRKHKLLLTCIGLSANRLLKICNADKVLHYH